MKLLGEIKASLKSQIAEAEELLRYLNQFGNDNVLVATPPRLSPDQPPIQAPAMKRKTKRVVKPGRPNMVLDVRNPKSAKPAAAAPAAPTTVDDLIGKPITLGGAMKKLIAGLNRFTGQELRDKLLADPPVAKLIQEGNPGSDTANLRYWAKVGYLNMAGETPLEATFTVANRDFFTR